MYYKDRRGVRKADHGAAILIGLSILPNFIISSLFKGTSLYRPIWPSCLLYIGHAIEFPWLFAYHPTVATLKPLHQVAVQSSGYILFQVALYLLVEAVFQRFILAFVINDSAGSAVKAPTFLESHEWTADPASKLTICWMRTSGTLLLTSALFRLFAAPYRHPSPIAVTIWITMDFWIYS